MPTKKTKAPRDSHEACQALRDAGRLEEATEMGRRMDRATTRARVKAKGD